MEFPAAILSLPPSPSQMISEFHLLCFTENCCLFQLIFSLFISGCHNEPLETQLLSSICSLEIKRAGRKLEGATVVLDRTQSSNAFPFPRLTSPKKVTGRMGESMGYWKTWACNA